MLSFRSISKIRTFPEKGRRMGPSEAGYANKLRVVLGLKEGREAEAIVAVVDRDGVENRGRITDLNAGRDVVRAARKSCAVGVAVEMIEAWLLADEKALCSALGDDGIQRQPDPENLTSRDEASDHNPKGRLSRLLTRCLGREVSREDVPGHYTAIATATDVGVLEQRCQVGFAPFAQQVRELVRP